MNENDPPGEICPECYYVLKPGGNWPGHSPVCTRTDKTSADFWSRRNNTAQQSKMRPFELLEYLLLGSCRRTKVGTFSFLLELSSEDCALLKKASGVLSHQNFCDSRYWKLVTNEVKRLRIVCERCGATDNLLVHHKTYENKGNEHLHLDDLTLLCKHCHRHEHKARPVTPAAEGHLGVRSRSTPIVAQPQPPPQQAASNF